ncbi:MAG: glycosyltransferase family 39 protein [bacterium]
MGLSERSLENGSVLSARALGVRFLLVCCLLGYGLRFGFLVAGSEQFSRDLGDQLRYLSEAENLLDHGTFATSMDKGPTAFDGPVYAVFLVPFLALFRGNPGVSVAAVQSVVSLLTAWMLAQIAWLITRRVWAARIALLWWCVYPFAVFYSAYILSETLYTAGIVASVWCAYLFSRDLRLRTALLFGLVLGLTSLTRPTINPCIPFLFLAVLAFRWDERRRTLKGLVISGLVLAAVLIPWIARNYTVFGRILPGSSQVGRMLYLANNPGNQTGYVVIPRDADPPGQDLYENELEYNDRLGDLAKEFIRENPGRFLWLCGMRVCRFWWPVPVYEKFSSPLLLIGSFFTFMPLFAAALWGVVLLRREWRILLPILGVILATYLLHLVFGVSMRYRFPIEPLLIIPASYSLSLLFQSRFTPHRSV